MNHINIEMYGFSELFASKSALYTDLYPGRIISQSKNSYRVICENGDLIAEVSGKFRFEAKIASDFPAVGDFVMLDRNSCESGNAVIHQVLPRKSAFIRKAAGTANEEQIIATNIDRVFICMSLNNDFNLRRLERYLSISWDSGAIPVVVLTKADLCADVPEKFLSVQSVAMGADVLVTSAMEQDGYEQINDYMKEKQTIALIGSSGVGKSTLVNRLLGVDKFNTNKLRNDEKGKHTTTRRELILLENGALLIDTPGMRELGMWDGQTGLDRTFTDVESFFAHCRFNDCTHVNEPGCAIRTAIEKGELPAERWFSYLKLKQEVAFLDNKGSYFVQKEQKFKDIAKANKANKKNQE